MADKIEILKDETSPKVHRQNSKGVILTKIFGERPSNLEIEKQKFPEIYNESQLENLPKPAKFFGEGEQEIEKGKQELRDDSRRFSKTHSVKLTEFFGERPSKDKLYGPELSS